MSVSKFVIVVTDGDADYTSVYATPEAITTDAEARALEANLPGDDGDFFFRVLPIASYDDFVVEYLEEEEDEN